MVDMTAIVYAMVMRLSNVEKLTVSGLSDIVIDDLWFKCAECRKQFHSDELALVGVLFTGEQYLDAGSTCVVQRLGSFFSLTDEGIGGLHDDLKPCDGVALRCLSCIKAVWNIELEVVQGETPEGWRHQ